MQRSVWSLLAPSAILLVVGAVHAGWRMSEYARHPEYSAPSSVQLVTLVPYVLAAAVLAAASLWLGRRPR